MNLAYFQDLIEEIARLVFPPRCPVCKSGTQDIICPGCIQDLTFNTFIYIPEKTVHIDLAVALSLYDGPLRKALMEVKFRHRKRIITFLAELMKDADLSPLGEADMIVPVPLSMNRLKKRGFNQAAVIAEGVARQLGIPLSGILERKRDTRPQFSLSEGERFGNVKDAFFIEETKDLEGKTLLVVDDILTTGATVDECSRLLKRNGAEKVTVLTLARTPDALRGHRT
jgi:competence protein ComFC